MLGVSEDEMRVLDLRHLVSVEIKRERGRERKKVERRAAGAVSREAYLAGSLSQKKPWACEGISRQTWERRRARNLTGTTTRVASPSGCMVAEPSFLGSLEGSGNAVRPNTRHPCMAGDGKSVALCTIMQREARQLVLPLSYVQPEMVRAEFDGWNSGVAPLIVRRAIIHELRSRELRHNELAKAMALSRPQMTNILRGRFGTSAAKADTLKGILLSWTRAA